MSNTGAKAAACFCCASAIRLIVSVGIDFSATVACRRASAASLKACALDGCNAIELSVLPMTVIYPPFHNHYSNTRVYTCIQLYYFICMTNDQKQQFIEQ